MRGRKPKPTTDKVLAGNPGRRELNEDEPTYAAASAEPPAHLSKGAREEWVRVAPALVEKGVLTEPDRTTLAAYCEAYAMWVQAKHEVEINGLTVESAQGEEKVSPYVRIVSMSVQQMVRLASELGITPASRSRVKAEKPMKEQSLAELLFAGVATDGKAKAKNPRK